MRRGGASVAVYSGLHAAAHRGDAPGRGALRFDGGWLGKRQIRALTEEIGNSISRESGSS